MSKLKCGLIQMGLKGDGTMSPEKKGLPKEALQRLFIRVNQDGKEKLTPSLILDDGQR